MLRIRLALATTIGLVCVVSAALAVPPLGLQKGDGKQPAGADRDHGRSGRASQIPNSPFWLESQVIRVDRGAVDLAGLPASAADLLRSLTGALPALRTQPRWLVGCEVDLVEREQFAKAVSELSRRKLVQGLTEMVAAPVASRPTTFFVNQPEPVLRFTAGGGWELGWQTANQGYEAKLVRESARMMLRIATQPGLVARDKRGWLPLLPHHTTATVDVEVKLGQTVLLALRKASLTEGHTQGLEPGQARDASSDVWIALRVVRTATTAGRSQRPRAVRAGGATVLRR